MSATVAIVDYGSGNLRSAEKALARAAHEGATGHAIAVTADPETVAGAERIVLPGVGAFADCMAGLGAIPGMRAALEEAVRARGRPFLGICVGMQLLADVGREHVDCPGLGWIPGEVVRITPAADTAPLPPSVALRASAGTFPLKGGRKMKEHPSPLEGEGGPKDREGGSVGHEGGRKEGGTPFKIPHMGWNEIRPMRPHPLLEGVPEGAHVYFVHSYEFRAADPAHVLATTDYGGPIAAMIGRDNIAGTQFHPEKSQAVGLALLGRFLRWRP